MFVQEVNPNGFSVKAWQGDAKTLLAFNFSDAKNASDLAGFTIQVQPHGTQPYYLFNKLTFAAGKHAVVAGEPPESSANAPFQKFRWLHVPGIFHQGENVFYGGYTYKVTPRYFQNGVLQPIDETRSGAIDIQVVPFATNQVQIGFTRGFTQSQAFVRHFGTGAPFRPSDNELLFDTTAKAGTNNQGETFTFLQEYQWSGSTARQIIFNALKEIEDDDTLSIDIFAYDLNEPDVLKSILKLASQGRVRLILDNASLHHKPGAAEDEVETQFNNSAKSPAGILRGKFGRYSHDKIFIVSKGGKPVKVMSGSTNFSVTGMYVNSNHVIVFNNADVASLYSQVFDEAWDDNVSMKFTGTSFAAAPFSFNQKGLPEMSVSFSPHTADLANSILQGIADRVAASKSSVLFAVMDLSGGGPVYPALQALHSKQQIYSYGISDSTAGISLYKPGTADGVLVTGKPGSTVLPPPFDKERAISGVGHQIHHKFIVCDFNTDDPVVWCGSSNLAAGGEGANGDNLIQLHDTDLATVFALEALALVDHFDFRNRHEQSHVASNAAAPTAMKGKPGATKTSAKAPPKKPTPVTPTSSAAMNLYANDTWAQRYFDKNDLYCEDRILFG
jgi:phosphatidylserine/phosphatidylglycerophosphate/cardiolipin synthase-like enzyme